MKSESIVDYSDLSKPEDSSNNLQSETDTFSSKKRRRRRNTKTVPWSKKEEEKILKYALKMSEKEYKRKKSNEANEEHVKKLNEIPDVATYMATEKDFQNPMKMFDKIWNEEEASSGIIKIVPPANWIYKQKEFYENNYKLKISTCSKKLNTRKQTLNDLYLAQTFEHAREFNYVEYHEMARIFFKTLYKADEGKIELEKIEEDYWNTCQESSKPFKVQYAADIPLSKYYSKEELFKMINEDSQNQYNQNNINKNKSEFSLLKANVMKNSMMQFTKIDDSNQISGITIPWFYMGMLYSSFCWHTEDLYLYSLNYMHEGSPKIWYSISHKQKEKMDEYIRTKYYATLLKQPDLIHRLTVHINPLELIQNGIKVFRVIQNPGDMIVTLPKGYHCGFSTGLNCAEAVNFSTPKWLDFGLKSQIDYKRNNSKLSVFPMEWLIMQNYENKKNIHFDDEEDLKRVFYFYYFVLRLIKWFYTQ